ncbi:MAG: hypothetical protein C0175_02690 [Caldisericum exile]|uniref:Uncharacterized protein n=1 Tax=Caldisericum exile TaxID=693075 RepID=A0A2J6X7H0_9BACT|nr:MAG: hypothetical protein C0175_02690 [Caldisericum exile]
MARSAVNVHVHQWLYDKMSEIKEKSGYTQADAFDVLFRTLDIEIQSLQQSLESTKKELENCKSEFDKLYNEKVELQKQLQEYEKREEGHLKVIQESKRMLKK